MKKIGSILEKYDPKIDKHISREFQSYGIHLAEELDDYKHRGLFIKLAKTHPRSLLDKALSFCVDSNAKNKGALFMWKLKELKTEVNKPVRTVSDSD
jgi:hypothetical protein